jgi:hypothetical protein
MRRVMGAVAAAAAATLAAAAVMAPAVAATRPAEHAVKSRPAAHGKAKHQAKPTVADVITSQLGDGGKYVTVVRCTGSVSAPPPVTLARLDDPLTVRGTRPTAGVIKQLAKPKTYKTVYSCTVTVKEKAPVPAKPGKPRKTHPVGCELGQGRPWIGGRSCHRVILNTGFGGEAGPVASHHPAG